MQRGFFVTRVKGIIGSIVGSGFLLVGFGILLVLNQTIQQDFDEILTERPPLTERDAPWNAKLLKSLSLGFAPVTVDFLLLQFLGDGRISHLTPTQKHAESFYVLDVATEIDPEFFALYFYGSGLLTGVRDDNLGASILATRGIKQLEGATIKESEAYQKRYWPEPWRLYLNELYLAVYEAQDMPRAERALDRAIAYPNSPPYFKAFRERLKTEEGRYEVSFRTLEHMLKVQQTEEGRAPFLKRQQDLKLNFWLYQMNQKYQTKSERRALVGTRDPLGGVLSVNHEGLLDTTSERARNPWDNKDFIEKRYEDRQLEKPNETQKTQTRGE